MYLSDQETQQFKDPLLYSAFGREWSKVFRIFIFRHLADKQKDFRTQRKKIVICPLFDIFVKKQKKIRQKAAPPGAPRGTTRDCGNSKNLDISYTDTFYSREMGGNELIGLVLSRVLKERRPIPVDPSQETWTTSIVLKFFPEFSSLVVF